MLKLGIVVQSGDLEDDSHGKTSWVAAQGLV